MSDHATTIRPDSGGLIELSNFRSDDAEPDEEPSIMLEITEHQPSTQAFALGPETARRLALALLEQVDGIEAWRRDNS